VNDQLILEILTRGGAVGAFIGLALVIAKPPLTPARVTGVLFCIGAAGHTLTQDAVIRQAFGFALAPFWAFSVMTAGLFWAFATQLFEDRPRLEAIRLIPAAVLAITGIGILLTAGTARNAMLILHNVMSFALMAHVLIVIWNGWRSDLVESRRRLRGPILAAAAVYALIVIAVQISEVVWRPADSLSPVAAVTLLIIGLAGIAALLQADPGLFATQQPLAPAAVASIATAALAGEDAKTAEKLDRLMRTERIYRDENLSIGALALKLGVAEYRLRRLINQHLGHRNFNAYLNGWRLADAKQALADPGQREVPISTIALDAGFQSLGPFNRAFKGETGLTPSEYRDRSTAAVTA
jgi:AraC-like DNA-binding protein